MHVANAHEVHTRIVLLYCIGLMLALFSLIAMPFYATLVLSRDRQKLIKNWSKEILIKWHFPDDDEDMEEAGEEYADIVEVPFEQVSYSVD